MSEAMVSVNVSSASEPQTHTLYVNRRMTVYPHPTFPVHAFSCEEAISVFGKDGGAIFCALQKIQGIERVCLRPYLLMVTIGSASWETMKQDIIKALQSTLGEDILIEDSLLEH